ncbi:MAG: hypothetical protein IPN57_03220 [Ignavibacteria bacterium]|nr:hypothetical protein [Ignavibacteria bacterium]
MNHNPDLVLCDAICVYLSRCVGDLLPLYGWGTIPNNVKSPAKILFSRKIIKEHHQDLSTHCKNLKSVLLMVCLKVRSYPVISVCAHCTAASTPDLFQSIKHQSLQQREDSIIVKMPPTFPVWNV